MQPIPVVLVGGFLGAGKTTLLERAAAALTARGQRVGLVTNDQAANLVDTAVLVDDGLPVLEVSGGCFCCRFDALVGSFDRLVAETRPDVLLGEPVGSCTDLAATVIAPLQRFQADRFRPAPFSVLVDPARARQALASDARPAFSDDVTYIFRKQLEEADVVVLNKTDALGAPERAELTALLGERFPGRPVFSLSALRGEGVAEWLDYVQGDAASGGRVAEVDYDRYAAGEAALGWLNASVRLCGDGGTDWSAAVRELVEAIRGDLRRRGAEIAHLKLHLAAGSDRLAANVTSGDGPVLVRGAVSPAARDADLVLNARAHAAPDTLRAVVERALAGPGGGLCATIVDLACFAPGRPQPTHRFGR